MRQIYGFRERSSRGGWSRCSPLVGFTLLLLGSPTAQADSAALAAADRLVSAVYYEGLPYETARSLDLEQVGYLATLLDDPGRGRDFPNIVLALGIAGHSGSFEILRAHPGTVSGELSRERWNAVRVRYAAMGHLARFEPRAEAWLVARARGLANEPEISFRALQGERMRRERRLAALRGLALAGTDSARRVLVQFKDDLDPWISTAARAALGRIDRIREVGPDAFFRKAGNVNLRKRTPQ